MKFKKITIKAFPFLFNTNLNGKLIIAVTFFLVVMLGNLFNRIIKDKIIYSVIGLIISIGSAVFINIYLPIKYPKTKK